MKEERINKLLLLHKNLIDEEIHKLKKDFLKLKKKVDKLENGRV